MIRSHCNIFGVDGGIHTKNGGKTYASCAKHGDTCINPKYITMIPKYMSPLMTNFVCCKC